MSSTRRAERQGPECRAVTRLLLRLPDGELRVEERDRIEAHLDSCARCRAEAAAHRGIGALLRAEPDPGALLPSGSEVVTRILETEAARARPALWTSAWMPGLALAVTAAALVAWLGPRSPEEGGRKGPAPTSSITAALPALVVEDDERTGRQVLLGPGLPDPAVKR